MLTPATLTYLPTSYCFFIVTSPSSSSSFILAQCVLDEMASREAELGGLREKAHRLWEGQAAGKGFVHRVSQLSAQYLALSNLTKVTLPPSRSPAPPSCPFTVCLCLCLRNCSMLKCALLSSSTVSAKHYRAFSPAVLCTAVQCYLPCHASFPSRTSVKVAVISSPCVKRLHPYEVVVSIPICQSPVIYLSPLKGPCCWRLINIKRPRLWGSPLIHRSTCERPDICQCLRVWSFWSSHYTGHTSIQHTTNSTLTAKHSALTSV